MAIPPKCKYCNRDLRREDFFKVHFQKTDRTDELESLHKNKPEGWVGPTVTDRSAYFCKEHKSIEQFSDLTMHEALTHYQILIESNMNKYVAAENRYEKMNYRRCGNSGIKLPELSLGLWHNFGGVDDYETGKDILHTAFDNGITHFDLANNYGPPPGSAEENFGKVMATSLKAYRDELIISSKAGWGMWPGPYGDWGSRKYLVASCDASLKRMQLDYLDIFYHHRPDPETPMEESMQALDFIVRSGRALYVGISSYSAEETARAVKILNDLGTPCLIHQPKYNLFDRWVEHGLTDILTQKSIGMIPFSPLHQGILTNKYLDKIPEDSRAGKESGFLQKDQILTSDIEKVRQLKPIADQRGQSIAQLAIAWLLNKDFVTSVLIGVSRKSQLFDNLKALDHTTFNEEEISKIESILNQ